MNEKYFITFCFLCIILQCNVNCLDCPLQCRCTEKTIACLNTQLKYIPKLGNKRISFLSLANNQIKKIEINQFKEFEDIVQINLGYNEITYIEENSFRGPLDLQHIDLRNNNLTILPDEIFSDQVESLNFLSLANNKLTSLPYSLENLLNLKKIELYGNPLHCGCNLRFFAKSLKAIEVYSNAVYCETPETLQRQIIKQINFEDFCPLNIENAQNAPIIIKAPENIHVAIGDSAKFICKINDIKNAIVKWQVAFNDSSYHSFYSRHQILLIHEVHEFHAGIITCTASNNIESISSSVRLTIAPYQRPYIVEGPSSMSVKEGSRIIFRCRAQGYPRPEIKWLWVKTRAIGLETEGKFTVRKNILIIDNITSVETVGRYVCYASSLAGSAKVSSTITIETNKPGNHEKSLSKTVDKIEIGKLKNEQLQNIINEATIKINKAFKITADKLRDPNRQKNRADIQSLFRQPSQAAHELSKASEVYEKVIDDLSGILRENKVNLNVTGNNDENLDFSLLLSVEQLAIISQLSGCQRSTEELFCSQQLCFHKKYRSIDGICNNLIHPRRGSALSPLNRLLVPEYENGINTPIGWSPGRLYNGFPKPSARLVSSKLLSANKVSHDPYLTAMVMQWGQFLDHDLDFTPVDASTSRFNDGLPCNETCVNDSPCFPILTPPGDLRIKRPCIGFSRSIATCGSGQSSIILGKLHYRDQVNQITSFIDGSNVYSSDPLESTELRNLEYDEGKLRIGPETSSKKRLLPFTIRGQIDCQIDPAKSHIPCFKAGDHRSNENLGLLVMHTLWMREHNRVADELKNLNNHWTGDKLFHEARKIVGASMQHITYKYWLPIILGDDGMKILGEYRGYNDSVDPSISNVFSTAAMRFGHTLINPILFRLNEDFNTIQEGNLPLHKVFFAPDMILQDGGIDPIIRGLFAKGAKAVKSDEPMNSELTEKLFFMAHEVALDLGALNIQRGRDHGLPNYNTWRSFCGLKQAEDFDDFAPEIPSFELREKMRQVYGHPGNVDIFAGSVLEQKISNGLIGPTFRCLLIDQFRRLRDGDRFWYENPDIFSSTQLSQIRQVSLSRIICDNSDNISYIQENAFFLPRDNIKFKECNEISKINLIPWKECYDSSQTNPEIQVPVNNRYKRSNIDHHSQYEIKNYKNELKDIKKRLKKLENLLNDI